MRVGSREEPCAGSLDKSWRRGFSEISRAACRASSRARAKSALESAWSRITDGESQPLGRSLHVDSRAPRVAIVEWLAAQREQQRGDSNSRLFVLQRYRRVGVFGASGAPYLESHLGTVREGEACGLAVIGRHSSCHGVSSSPTRSAPAPPTTQSSAPAAPSKPLPRESRSRGKARALQHASPDHFDHDARRAACVDLAPTRPASRADQCPLSELELTYRGHPPSTVDDPFRTFAAAISIAPSAPQQ